MPLLLETDFWHRVLRLVETVEEATKVLAEDPLRVDDMTELEAFSTAGVLCDITRSPLGLERLLSIMGPLSVQACRDEVAAHRGSRGFDETAVDWSSAGTKFQIHTVDPRTIIPLRN